MADYRLRLHRKFPQKEIQQFVIYLTRSDSPLVFQTSFEAGKLTHEFNVIRLWEQPTEIFQQYPGLLPLAVLTQTNNRIQTLTEVAKQIDNIEGLFLVELEAYQVTRSTYLLESDWATSGTYL